MNAANTVSTLKDLIEINADKFSNRPSLSFVGERPTTYAELKDQVDRLVEFLDQQGVESGDRVAILSENSPNWGVAYFAIASRGAIVVPILPDFHPSEVHHILRHSEAKAVFISERYYYKIEDLELEKSPLLILLDTLSIIDPKLPKATIKRIIAEGSKELEKIRQMARRLVRRGSTHPSPNDVASIIYTSGTTGHSKGVMLTHSNIIGNADASAEIPRIRENDRMLSILPLAHVYECTLGLVLPLLKGASVYYLRKPPTPAVLLPAVEEVKPTAMLTVPLIIEKMHKNKILPEIQRKKLLRLLYKMPPMRKRINRLIGKKLMRTFGGEVRFFGIGGASLSPEVEKFLREAHFPYAIGYGLTETSPLIAGSDAQHTRFQSTGPVMMGVEVVIHDPNPQTGEGEIWTRSPFIMNGYYRDPERTAQVLTDDGWFRTGDLGVFDEDHYLYIKGRLKNVIIGPSGENIYPEAIESLFDQEEIVLESVVYQVQNLLVARIHLNYEKLDNDFAQEGLTEAQSRERILTLLEDLRRSVNDRVSSFSKIARVIEQTEPFEKTPTQKIKRYLYTN